MGGAPSWRQHFGAGGGPQGPPAAGQRAAAAGAPRAASSCCRGPPGAPFCCCSLMLQQQGAPRAGDPARGPWVHWASPGGPRLAAANARKVVQQDLWGPLRRHLCAQRMALGPGGPQGASGGSKGAHGGPLGAPGGPRGVPEGAPATAAPGEENKKGIFVKLNVKMNYK